MTQEMNHQSSSQCLIYSEAILALPMFHAQLESREKAEEYLKKNAQGPGTFLVRPNSIQDPSYVSISISLTEGKMCHVKVFIEKSEGKYRYYMTKENKFGSFNGLLEYFSIHRIHCFEKLQDVRLRFPLGREGAILRDCYISTINDSAAAGNNGATAGDNDSTAGNNGSTAGNNGSTAGNNGSTVTTASAPPKNMIAVLGNIGATPMNISPSLGNKGAISSIRIKSLPPAPLPKPSSRDFSDCYSYVDPSRNFFEETYKFLKKSEMCDCGISMYDSELPHGWVMHYSLEKDSYKKIFYQRDQITTWDIPEEIVPLLSLQQIGSLLYLHEKEKHQVPACLRKCLEDQKEKETQENE